MSLSEEDYERRAFPELRALIDALDAIDDESVDAELASDILTIEFDDGTRYVVNSHRAARQIWMAAERAAWHFDFVPEKQQWLSDKGGDELWATLESVIGRKLGHSVKLRS